jgi:hypothetical protein
MGMRGKTACVQGILAAVMPNSPLRQWGMVFRPYLGNHYSDRFGTSYVHLRIGYRNDLRLGRVRLPLNSIGGRKNSPVKNFYVLEGCRVSDIQFSPLGCCIISLAMSLDDRQYQRLTFFPKQGVVGGIFPFCRDYGLIRGLPKFSGLVLTSPDRKLGRPIAPFNAALWPHLRTF